MKSLSKWARLALVTVSISAVAVTGLPGTAHADPEAVAKAKAKVDQLGMEAAALDQQSLDAQQRLDDARQRLDLRSGDVTTQSARVEKMRDQVGQVALAQFQSRDIDPTTQIFLNSGDDFLNRYSTVQQFSANQNNVLADFQTQQANLGDMKLAAAADVETIDRAGQEITKLRTESTKKQDQAEAEFNKLSAEEKQRITDEAAKEAAEAEARAAEAEQSAVSRDEDRSPNPSASSTPKSSNSASKKATPSKKASSKASQAGAVEEAPAASSGSGRASEALAYARAQVGKSYASGGVGPSSYDCSGLTMMAWKSAGVSIPRTSQSQYSAGRSVSKSDLQPGDLVFYYGGISHVGMYVGGGQIVHASRPGKPLGYASVDSMPYQGARRVG